MKYDLSILIPARNEMFLAKTIENILENIEGKTEIIVLLDGQWSDPPIADDPRIRIIYYPESIGQRAGTNKACSLSKAKYVMKVDAHCAFDKGFDVKLINKMQDDYTMVPIMKNLHAFDWVCDDCGQRWYQGPTPTFCHKDYDKTKEINPNCNNTTRFHRDIVWRGKRSPNSTSYSFDSTPHFQYFAEYTKRPEFEKDRVETGLTESMSLQGSCFLLTREKYWELNISDENFGSWGSQGIEVACKTWLSGGRVVCNHDTWYAHMFRTQGGDFGFPYPLPGSQVARAKELAKSYFTSGQFKQQIRPLSWLIEKFWPVPGWESIPDMTLPTHKESKHRTKGIIFYTDNQLKLSIAKRVQKNLMKISTDKNIPIVSSSLKPMNFGKNIYSSLKRGYLTMFKQILSAIEACDADYIFFCEHDILYHPSHFDFTPTRDDVYYYNENVWKVRYDDGHALHYDCKQLSGLCASKKLVLKHYQDRVRRVEDYINAVIQDQGQITDSDLGKFIREMGFEPGTHNRDSRVDNFKSESWFSEYPNVDIRHDGNLTPSRWSKDKFRSQNNCKNWIESDEIPGWGRFCDFF